MRLSGDGVVPVRLHGAWNDRTLDYDAEVQLEAGVLRVAFDAAQPTVITLPVGDLSGADFHDDVLRLHAVDGRVVALSASAHLDGLRHRLEAQASVFPAQTLSLRGFGSERSLPGSDHDSWFDGLLTARRVAEESRTIETQRRAFDAERLRRHIRSTIDAWAAARFDEAADRRALSAELAEIAAPYDTALTGLEAAALELRQAPHAVQFTAWRAWTARVQLAFRAADDAWSLMVPVLCDSRGAKGTFWRRLLRRGDAHA